MPNLVQQSQTQKHFAPTSIPQKRVLKTTLPGPASQELKTQAATIIPRAIASSTPAYVRSAEQGIIKDIDGNQLIDFASGIAVTSVGAAHPKVVEAVQQQVKDFTHTCFMVTPYEQYLQVASALNRLTPGTHEKRTALFNSGAEAVENAIKVSRAHTGRQAIVAFDHAFHGRTSLTMSLTAKAEPYKTGFGPFASEIYRMPNSYPYRDGLSGPEAAARSITMMEKQIGANQIAGIIIEPIQGEGGFIVPAPGFLPALQKWCNDNGIVFIVDEIQTGFARTGKMFASEYEGIVPDLITSAKGIAAGLPLSAVTGRAEIMNSPGPGSLGGTYGGNPVACAAALASMEVIEEENLTARAKEIENITFDRWKKWQEVDPRIGEYRGRGAMIALELIHPDSKQPDPQLTSKIASQCRENGLILLTCGTYSNVIRLLPPLTISNELLVEGLEIIESAFKESR